MPTDAGIHDLTFTSGDGTTVRYTLALPPPTPKRPPPLVLVLHYGGPPAGFYGRPLLEQLLLPALDPLNAVFVAPVSVGGDWTNAANETVVYELHAFIEKHYATDPARRVIAGYSMGGVGTWHFIERRADFFSAGIAISGFKPVDPANCTTPMFVLHSTVDAIFDADALREQASRMTAHGCRVTVTFLDGVDHFNVPAFGPKLHEAAAWLDEIWSTP